MSNISETEADPHCDTVDLAPEAQATFANPLKGNLLKLRRTSARAMLRAFQDVRTNCSDPGFMQDLEYLEHKDLDLSIRLGAMLAFNALLISMGSHPISSSPGAPLSLDAPTQPWENLVVLLGIAAFAISSLWCLRAILIGEEFDPRGTSGDALKQRLFAAYIRSVDSQTMALRRAVRATIIGATITLGAWGWILIDKMV
jgi:hypothetical protein